MATNNHALEMLNIQVDMNIPESIQRAEQLKLKAENEGFRLIKTLPQGLSSYIYVYVK